jgi:hypothetical protein
VAISDPQVGLVISYAFLWSHEHSAGAQEGRKSRPCAIVVASDDDASGEPRIIVAPITHSPPKDPRLAVEIPAKVKAHLGLDADRSWVVCTELNRFTWPGYDLRPIPGQTGNFAYGMLPRQLFETIRRQILDLDAALRTVTER